uniref:NADH dehydrogenase subunit 4 n=1 Tax=Spilarctia alba TaxID=1473149 RepID=A0A1S7C7K2_9NEOP|nr:NADH dehydrogenase subunit 4 [Spilarctia alba]
MKFLMMMMFMIPFCFMKNMFWLVQMMLFLMMFLFMNLMMEFNLFCNLSYMLSCDIMSYGLIMLSIWISILMIMASENLFKVNFYVNFFLFNIIFLLIMLYLTFSVMNMFMFYLFFEGSLILTLMVNYWLSVSAWTYQCWNMFIILYFICFFTVINSNYMYMFWNKKNNNLFFKIYKYEYFYIMFLYNYSFFSKNTYMFCSFMITKSSCWSSCFSIYNFSSYYIKISGVWFITFNDFFTSNKFKIKLYQNCNQFSWWILYYIKMFLSNWYKIFNCLFFSSSYKISNYSYYNYKLLSVYSFLYYNNWSWFMFFSNILFSKFKMWTITKTKIMYKQSNNKFYTFNKIMMIFINIFKYSSSSKFKFNSSNQINKKMMSWSWLSMIMLMMISFFSAGYSLYLYSFVQHGKYYSGIYSYYTGVCREYLILVLHWLPLNLMIMKVDYSMIWF